MFIQLQHCTSLRANSLAQPVVSLDCLCSIKPEYDHEDDIAEQDASAVTQATGQQKFKHYCHGSL